MQAVVNDASFGSVAQPIAAPAAASAKIASNATRASSDTANTVVAVSASADTFVEIAASTSASTVTTTLRNAADADSLAPSATTTEHSSVAIAHVPAAPTLPEAALVQAPSALAQVATPAPGTAMSLTAQTSLSTHQPSSAGSTGAGQGPAGVLTGPLASSLTTGSDASGGADFAMPGGAAGAGNPALANQSSQNGQSGQGLTHSGKSEGADAFEPSEAQAQAQLQTQVAQSKADGASGTSPTPDPHTTLIDQWFSRDPSNDELTLLDEILRGDSGASAQIQLSSNDISAQWQRSHAYLNQLAGRPGAGESYPDGADVSGWSNMGLDAGRFAMPGGFGRGNVGLRGVAGHEIKSFKGLQEGINPLGAL